MLVLRAIDVDQLYRPQTKRLLVIAKRTINPPFSVFGRTVFFVKFSKVLDFEKMLQQTPNYIFCHTVVHDLVAVSIFCYQNNKKK